MFNIKLTFGAVSGPLQPVATHDIAPWRGSDIYIPSSRGSLRSPRANHDIGPPGLRPPRGYHNDVSPRLSSYRYRTGPTLHAGFPIITAAPPLRLTAPHIPAPDIGKSHPNRGTHVGEEFAYPTRGQQEPEKKIVPTQPNPADPEKKSPRTTEAHKGRCHD